MLVLASATACSLVVDLDNLAGPPESSASEGGVVDGSDRVDSPADVGGSETGGDAGSECPPAPPDPSLVAWYPFEESSLTSVHDCSGHGLDGTFTAGRVARTDGRIGRAIELDGVKGCFDLGAAPTLAFAGNPFTVTAWVKPRTFSYVPGGEEASADPKPRWFFGHLGHSSGVPRGWGVGTDNDEDVELKIFRDDGNYIESQTKVPTDAFVHVAAVYVPGKMEIYVAGASAVVTQTTDAPSVDPEAHGWLGCREGEPPFDGIVDEVRVYDRVLKPEEIAALAK
jgi:arabinan endo-1,5-alpha-L-arabinosidase